MAIDDELREVVIEAWLCRAPRTLADAARGKILKAKVKQLDRLIEAFRRGEIRMQSGGYAIR